MKAQLRNHVAALFILMPVAATLVAMPTAAVAQARPAVDSMDVSSDGGVSAGARLEFTVEGTPRGQASVRVQGIARNIPLKEVSRGVYEGGVTIRKADKVTEASAIRASIRVRNRTSLAAYNFPAGVAGNPVAVAPRPQPMAGPLKIERFSVATLSKIEPGAELKFSLNGPAGAVAEFDIPGVVNNVPMREVRPGTYEGSYTVKRLDNLSPSRPIIATLRLGGQSVSSTLTQPLLSDAKPPVIRNMYPREGETVLTRATAISATFDDAGGLGIDPRSVRVLLSGRNVTAESQITPQFFTYRADLPPGRHTVDVTARDLAGNAMRRTWTFDVVTAVGALPTFVPLQVTSHSNNALIGGGPTVIQGRTAPGAVVDVKVSAVASVVGMFGVSQEVLNQRVQADGNGNFSFTFTPQLPLPGTRYEVTMVSNKADVRAESKLVLFQRQG